MESIQTESNKIKDYVSSTTGEKEGNAQSLLEAKLARKKIEEDTKLLENRIALLELEEKKSKKKIDDTKKKAEEIKHLKMRNKEMIMEKQNKKAMEDEELNQKAEELKKFKQQNLKSLEEKKKLHQDRILKEASDMKTKKKETKAMKFVQEEEIYKKNNQSVQITKNSEKQLVLKKQDFRANKIQEVKKDYQGKIAQELFLKNKKAEEIAALERKEMELIQKLQTTQDLQKTALADLEKVISKAP